MKYFFHGEISRQRLVLTLERIQKKISLLADIFALYLNRDSSTSLPYPHQKNTLSYKNSHSGSLLFSFSHTCSCFLPRDKVDFSLRMRPHGTQEIHEMRRQDKQFIISLQLPIAARSLIRLSSPAQRAWGHEVTRICMRACFFHICSFICLFMAYPEKEEV